jgi:nucleoside-diphosphate-sugar epimerase
MKGDYTMNIFITGATGRLGSRLVPRLLQRGHSVRMLVRQSERAQTLIDQGAVTIVGDLLQPETFTETLGRTDAIIHLAAFFRGATAEETKSVNLEGTLALAHAALQAGVTRFLFASTNLVYGPGHGELFREDSPTQPAAPYPETKAAAEQALMELHQTRKLDLRILRFAFVYGENDPHLTEGLQWFRKWNPQQQMHLIHHADVAQATILAMEAQGVDGQIYNVADDKPVTAAEIMQIFNEPIVEEAVTRTIDPAWQQIVDTRKIHEKLGFQPMYPTLQTAVNAGVL